MQVYAVHASLISQLEAIGGMEEWVLYVAQHLPDGPSPDWQGLRDQLVCSIICFCGTEGNLLVHEDALLSVHACLFYGSHKYLLKLNL